MSISDIYATRRENLARLIASHRYAATQRAFAIKIDRSPAQVNQWLNRRRNVGDDSRDHIEDSLGLPRGWLDQIHSQGPQPTGVAHESSLDVATIPPFIEWEALMTNNVTPDEFRTRAPDDALSPRLRVGQVLTLDRRLQPRPGDGVLIIDKTGGQHLRIFRPGVGRWEAHASHPDYPALDSERDGLQVLAVLTGVEARWG